MEPNMKTEFTLASSSATMWLDPPLHITWPVTTLSLQLYMHTYSRYIRSYIRTDITKQVPRTTYTHMHTYRQCILHTSIRMYTYIPQGRRRFVRRRQAATSCRLVCRVHFIIYIFTAYICIGQVWRFFVRTHVRADAQEMKWKYANLFDVKKRMDRWLSVSMKSFFAIIVVYSCLLRWLLRIRVEQLSKTLTYTLYVSYVDRHGWQSPPPQYIPTRSHTRGANLVKREAHSSVLDVFHFFSIWTPPRYRCITQTWCKKWDQITEKIDTR